MLDTFEKTRAHADPEGFLEEVRKSLMDGGSPADTAHGQLLLDQARMAAQYGLAFLHHALELLHEDEALEAAYAPVSYTHLDVYKRQVYNLSYSV